jgi:copper chaperone
MTSRVYSVPAIHCGHCRQSIETEVAKAPGVSSIVVDLDAKTVTVVGGDDRDIRAAIDEAGFDVAGVS